MDNFRKVKGHITYRTSAASAAPDGSTETDEQFHEGDCLVETDEAGMPVCVHFEDTQGTGTLRLHDIESMTLTRKGIMSSKLLFVRDETSKAAIDTPYGSMELTLMTHEMTLNTDRSGARITSVYSFLEAPSERHNLSITVSL